MIAFVECRTKHIMIMQHRGYEINI